MNNLKVTVGLKCKWNYPRSEATRDLRFADCRSLLVELMSPKFKKQSALKLVGRIIHCAQHIWISCISKDIIPRPVERNFGHGLALGFIPVIKANNRCNADINFVREVYAKHRQ